MAVPKPRKTRHTCTCRDGCVQARWSLQTTQVSLSLQVRGVIVPKYKKGHICKGDPTFMNVRQLYKCEATLAYV